MPSVQTTCPEWEYKNVDGYNDILNGAAKALLSWLLTLDPRSNSLCCRDTRTIHQWFFSGLVPSEAVYYAGHYRGEEYLCLKHDRVGIASNPLVGVEPQLVAGQITSLAEDIAAALNQIDLLWQAPNALIDIPTKIRRVAELVAAIFNSFLIIHPYKNGNGHMARFIAIAIFMRVRIRPRKWPMHTRPADPPYSDLVRLYQQGTREPFIQFLLSCI